MVDRNLRRASASEEFGSPDLPFLAPGRPLNNTEDYAMAAYTVVSADSHVSEPGNLWLERMPAQLNDRPPRLVRKGHCGCVQRGGLPPLSAPPALQAGTTSRASYTT